MPPALINQNLRINLAQLKKYAEYVESEINAMEHSKSQGRVTHPASVEERCDFTSNCSNKAPVKKSSTSLDQGCNKKKSCPCKRKTDKVTVTRIRRCEACQPINTQISKTVKKPIEKTGVCCNCTVPVDHIHHRIHIPFKDVKSDSHRVRTEIDAKSVKRHSKFNGEQTWAEILSVSSSDGHKRSVKHTKDASTTKSNEGRASLAGLVAEQKQEIRKLKKKLSMKEEMVALQLKTFEDLQKELAQAQEDNDKAKLEIKLRALGEEKLKVLLESKQIHMNHAIPHASAIEKRLQDEIAYARQSSAALLKEQVVLSLRAKEFDPSFEVALEEGISRQPSRGVDESQARSVRRRLSNQLQNTPTKGSSAASTCGQRRTHSSPTPSEHDEIPDIPDISDLSSIRESISFMSI